MCFKMPERHWPMNKHIFMTIILAATLNSAKTAYAQEAVQQLQPSQQQDKHPITYGGGDGSSYDKAVIIKGAPSDYIGDLAEYHWLAFTYPGYRLKRQSLYFNHGKAYDLLDLKTQDNQSKTVYFDISDFYTKGQ